jgi:phosphohistidine phosphatase
MRAYLVQHGAAESKDVHPTRPLTKGGREDVERVAAFAARMGVEVHQIRHSGKTRAEGTAAILGNALSPAAGVVAVLGLAPRDDVRPVAQMLESESRSLMLVGHLPFMARLTALLVTGDAERSVLRFHQGGIVCLEREADRWLVAWALTPAMVAVG